MVKKTPLGDKWKPAGSRQNILKVLIPGCIVLLCVLVQALPGQIKQAEFTSSVRPSESEVLATVAGKVITVQDFKERSEFTVRPDNFKSKETTLHNLILEKILALEAEHSRKFTLTSGMQANVEGIKEQEMRAQLYYKEAFEKIKLNPGEVNAAYALATREYEVEFYRLPNKNFAERARDVMKNSPDGSARLFREIEETLGKQPLHHVKYEDGDDDAIHNALFTEPVDTGSVIGPVQLSDGGFLVMKINKWVVHPRISSEEQQLHWSKVSDVLRNRKAAVRWREYQREVMKGKRLEFQKQAFEALSAWARANYFKQKKDDSLHIPFVIEGNIPERDRGSQLFLLEKKAWTMEDFRNLIRTHPLVYRTTALDSSNFRTQFKLAVIDLIRDYYLTKAAYKKKLEKSGEVKKTVNLWKDSFFSSCIQKSIIDSGLAKGMFRSDDQRGRSEYWNAQLDALQNKYAKSITVNHELLKSITLTKIDMIAMKPGFPYPLEVPQFPLLRISENLNYAGDSK
ncbi:MAG: hypothetical protein EHM64_06650 [Ignavibacteriae bacterium]|nr:MAG: hypothetical protein EHM64_06650 [Ignavibacteriota bacterium]